MADPKFQVGDILNAGGSFYEVEDVTGIGLLKIYLLNTGHLRFVEYCAKIDYNAVKVLRDDAIIDFVVEHYNQAPVAQSG